MTHLLFLKLFMFTMNKYLHTTSHSPHWLIIKLWLLLYSQIIAKRAIYVHCISVVIIIDVFCHSFCLFPLHWSPGATSGSTDLLPTPSATTNWTASLVSDSGRDSDLIFGFDGHQAAKIPDSIVPQNLTDHFTIATWMKHGPSPGLRAEKETLLCNSDKTGESFVISELSCLWIPWESQNKQWIDFTLICLWHISPQTSKVSPVLAKTKNVWNLG